MATKSELIMAKAIEILKNEPQGIRYTQLVKRVKGALPEQELNTIHGTIWNIETRTPEIYKPARGEYKHAKFKPQSELEPQVEISEPPKIKVRESDFYDAFAKWLVNELEECTKAISLGGNRFKDKWGTPDVIGIREPRKSDIIKPPTEIVSAEIKLDSANLITAFGQACSYKLFSHKAYIVVPAESSDEDVARLDALARVFGIGLILFDSANTKEPEFQIRVRASRHEPDMFYVNKNMKLIEDDLFG